MKKPEKAAAVTPSTKVPWACPECGAKWNEHGKDGAEGCKDRWAPDGTCQGLVCECEDNQRSGSAPDHGETFSDVCRNAVCYHCGWEGSLPRKPKGLQAWEKKALDAGWLPPPKRATELGMKT